MSRADTRKGGLDRLYALLEADLGKGAGRPLPEREVEALERIPTGLLGVDHITGGGIPRGRVIEIYGGESSAKTTLSLRIMGEAQRMGLRVVYIDAEHSFDAAWAERQGVDISTMLYQAPDHGEQALKIAEQCIQSGEVQLVVVDSVAALVPLAEIEGEIGDRVMGSQARLMSQAMRRLTPMLAQQDATVIFTNQIREKLGVMFGSPETTPGGRALRFFASIRLETRRVGQLTEGGDRTGDTIRIRAVKNKTAPPFLQCETPLYYGVGFDPVRETLALALERGLLSRRGAWYYQDGTQLGQGQAGLLAWAEANPEAIKLLRTQCA